MLHLLVVHLAVIHPALPALPATTCAAGQGLASDGTTCQSVFMIGDVLSYVALFITDNAATLAGLMGLAILVKWASRLPRRFAK